MSQTSDPSKWLPLVPSLDVVIEAIGGMEIRTISAQLLKVTGDEAAKTRPPGAPKLTYIWTSGTWLHGDDHKTIKTDTSPITNPIPLIAWRPQQEQSVVTNTALNGIVIRPSLLYGRGGSLLGGLFKSALDGQVAWFGNPDDRWALIHTDDLAELFVLAAEKGQLVGGKIFDAANDFTESVDDVLKKLSELTSADKPPQYLKPTNRKSIEFPTQFTANSLRAVGSVRGSSYYYHAVEAILSTHAAGLEAS